MYNVKKLTVAALTLALSVSVSSVAFANNGKGNGLQSAPGQAVNFSKGITTIVKTEVRQSTNTKVDVATDVVTTVEPKKEVTVTKGTVESVTSEAHNNHPWVRDITTTTTNTTTTTSTWDETTTTTTVTTTETPVTVTETVEVTIQHHGAPGSNGKVLSTVEKVTSRTETLGTPVVTTETSKPVVTTSDVTSTSNTVTTSETVVGEWKGTTPVNNPNKNR